jgi:histidyl-tRNA synthetase
VSAKPRITPRLPKGMRDFMPAEMLKRDYVFGIVREVFHLYGFEPLQTPVMELRETLMGKYGEDAEKLIYNAKHNEGKEDLSLRYDLTVPLARVVAQHENELTFPFKRYQLSPVWRAERPQRGRYREFYQCDADIVGVSSMSAEAELVSMAVAMIKRLGFGAFVVKINNRKLLTAMGQYSGVPDEQLGDLYRSVDKFDKIGAEGVRDELLRRGINEQVVARMMELLLAQGEGIERLDFIEDIMGSLPDAQEGVRELRELADYLNDANVSTEFIDFDFTMVRGLSYYTGPIFETVLTGANMGSVSGGGRYDDLIGLFRKESLPTTGISFGIERIIDVMDDLKLYPAEIGGTVVQVLVTVFGDDTRHYSGSIASDLRANGIRTELFMQDAKIGKQFSYADKKGVPLVAIAGPDEVTQGIVKLKRLRDGVEVSVARTQLSEKARELLS